MTTSEILTLTAIFVTIGIALLGAYYKISDRIGKIEGHSKVCDEKHLKHDLKFLKQDEINLKVEKNHVEVMTALAVIGNDVKHLSK